MTQTTSSVATVKKNLFKHHTDVLGDYQFDSSTLSTAYSFKEFTIDITPRPDYDGNEALVLIYRPINEVLNSDYSESKFYVDLTPIVFAAPLKLVKNVNGVEQPVKVFSQEGGERVYEVVKKLLPLYYYNLGDFMGCKYKYYTTAIKLEYHNIALSGLDSIAGVELDFMVFLNYKSKSSEVVRFNKKVKEYIDDLLKEIVSSVNMRKLPNFSLELGETLFHTGEINGQPIVSARLSVTARSIKEVPNQFPLNYNSGIFLVVGLNLMKYVDYKVGEFISQFQP
jgi:hypothetical protein